jgi:hypothetical protein
MLTKTYRTWPHLGTQLVFEFFRGSNDFKMKKVYLLRLMPVCIVLIIFSCLFLSVKWSTTAQGKMQRCLPLVPYYSESEWYWYQVKKVSVVPAHSIKSCIRQAVCQVVFTDVLIVGGLDVGGQSFVLIGLHKTDTASDWLLIKWHCIGMKCLPGVQLQN